MAADSENQLFLRDARTTGEYSRDEACSEENGEFDVQAYSMQNEEYWSQCRAKLQGREENLVTKLKCIHKQYISPRQAKVTALNELQSRVLFLRRAVALEKEAYSKEHEELQRCRSEAEAVSHSVFKHSLGVLKSSHSALRGQQLCRGDAGGLRRRRTDLRGLRREMVEEAREFLFPMEVESVTVDDEGDRSVTAVAPVADLAVDIELEGEWLLSGHTHLPAPRITINAVPLPINGNYIEYHSSSSSSHFDPQANSAARIGAGLSNIAQYVHLLQQILGVPLPYPTSLVEAVRDYGRVDLCHQTFAKLVSRLDTNLLFLCMTQHISPQALVAKGQGTISNLFTLVSHFDLESCPAFTCYPELLFDGRPPPPPLPPPQQQQPSSLMLDSMLDPGPPSLFPVHPTSPDHSLETRSLELATVEASLQEEFTFRTTSTGGGGVLSSPGTAYSRGLQHPPPGMSDSSGSVMASVSGLWNSVTKYWSGSTSATENK